MDVTFSPGMMADCIADLLCTNNCFSPVLFLIEMNDVFAKALWFVVLLLNVDIQSKSLNGIKESPLVLKTLVKITKQSLNSTEPKIAAPGHPKPF
jgi:hypothetical protein